MGQWTAVLYRSDRLANIGLQPTPTAFAPASLRLLARLRPGVRPLKKHMTQFTELLKGKLVDYTIEYRVHATRRMFQRHIGAEEVACILTHGQVIERYDEDFPLPSVLLNGRTAANRPVHVVVGINVDEQTLVIITTYEPDPLQWADNFSRRIV